MDSPFTKNYIDALKDLPDRSQLAITVIRDGKTDFTGILKGENGIHAMDNSAFAFEIGSITKVFTGNILAQLVIEGKVDVNDRIQSFLPFPVLDNPPITLRHLAQHTSGLPRLPDNFFTLPGYRPENPYLDTTEEQFAHYFSHLLRLDGSPGVKYQYSNLGMSLLSYIISRIESKPFPRIVSERVFLPLGMSQSSYDRDALAILVIKGIDKNGKVCSHWDAGIYTGSLGILSTSKDMAAFAAWQLDKQASACRYQSSVVFPVNTAVKSLLGWSENLFEPQAIRIRNINGGTGGFGSSLMLNPDAGTALVVLSNIEPARYLEKIVPENKRLFLEQVI